LLGRNQLIPSGRRDLRDIEVYQALATRAADRIGEQAWYIPARAGTHEQWALLDRHQARLEK